MISYCIVCGRRSHSHLKLLIDSIVQNSYYRDFEIIVCSKPNDEKKSFLSQVFQQVCDGQIIEIEDLTLAKGFNRCSEIARGDFLYFLKSDSFVGKHHDKELVDRSRCDLITSPWKIVPGILVGVDINVGNIIVDDKEFGTNPNYFKSYKFSEWVDRITSDGAVDFDSIRLPMVIRRRDFDRIRMDDKLITDIGAVIDFIIRCRIEGIKGLLTSKSVIFIYGKPVKQKIMTNEFYGKWGTDFKHDDRSELIITNEMREKYHNEINCRVKVIGG